jgi:hypothetical protein
MSDHEPARPSSHVTTPASETPQSVGNMVQEPVRAARRVACGSVQAKLTVGSAADPFEQEADQVAALVMRRIDGAAVARQIDGVSTTSRVRSSERPAVGDDHVGHDADTNSGRVQRSSWGDAQVSNTVGPDRTAPVGRIQRTAAEQIGAAGGSLDTDTEQRIQRARGGGRALPSDLSAAMGSAMGADFTGVRIHTDGQSNQLNQRIQAKAFTTGSDVFFREGEYRPTERSGQELLAHELTHVVQQGGAGVQRSHTPVVETSDVGGQISVVGKNPAGHIQRDYWEDRIKATYGPEGAEQYMNGSDEQREQMLEAATPQGDKPQSFESFQHLVDKAGFKKLTWQSRTARRGTTLKTIERELDDYHSLDYGEVNKRLGALHELRYAASEYIKGHEEDASRKKRLAGMHKFLLLVEKETDEVTALKETIASPEMGFAGYTSKQGEYQEGEAHRKLKAKVEADSGSFFTKLVPLLDGAAPPAGGSNELEIDVNIPVIAVPGLIIGGNMKFAIGKADDDSTYNLRTELALTTGFHIPGFTIKGKVGGYIESQAVDTTALSKLLSYGMYQRFRESEVVPSGVTNAFWGGSGSDIIGYSRAEAWAAEIEKEIFKPLHDLRAKAEGEESETAARIAAQMTALKAQLKVDLNAPGITEEERVELKESALADIEQLTRLLAESKQKSEEAQAQSLATYVETGGATGALVEGNLGIANAKTEFEATTGKRMDAESIQQNKGIGETRKKKDQSNKLMGGGWGGTKTIGKGTYTLSATSSFEAGPITGEYGWTLSSITDAKRETKTKSISVQFSGTVKTAMAGLAGVIIKAVPSLAQILSRMFNSPPDEGENARVYGAAAGQAPGIANAIHQVGNEPDKMAKAFSDPWGKGSDTQGFEGKVGVKLGGQLDIEDGGKPTGEVSVSLVETSELVPWVADSAGSTSANPLKVALAKNKKLIVWKFPGGVGELVTSW